MFVLLINKKVLFGNTANSKIIGLHHKFEEH